MQSLERSIEVLLALAQQSGVSSISELAQATQLPPSTVHRILKTLLSYGLVVQNEGSDRQYRFGQSMITLALAVLQFAPDYRDMSPLLRQLSDECHECCFVSTLVERQVICMQTVEVDDPHRARFYHRVGQVMPVHASASAKAILAFQPADVRDEIIARSKFDRFTSQTIVDPDEYRRSLESVRRDGFALCEEELELGVSAASVPVSDLKGVVRSSLTVVAPTVRIKGGLDDGLIKVLKSGARRLGLYLGS